MEAAVADVAVIPIYFEGVAWRSAKASLTKCTPINLGNYPRTCPLVSVRPERTEYLW
jgi:hypothetical protein